MDVEIGSEEVAMAVLNGPPSKHDNIITALDALGTESRFALEFVKSRLLQEEQLNDMRKGLGSDTAIVQKSHQQFMRTHCGRKGHTENRCWDKYPDQRPKLSTAKERPKALTVQKAERDEQEEVV